MRGCLSCSCDTGKKKNTFQQVGWNPKMGRRHDYNVLYIRQMPDTRFDILKAIEEIRQVLKRLINQICYAWIYLHRESDFYKFTFGKMPPVIITCFSL